MKKLGRHILVGVTVPVVLLLNAFLIPEPYSHPLIHIAIAPSKVMPFLENRELMGELTVYIFGRMTANFAPIQILFLIFFWFFFSLGASVLCARLKGRSKSAKQAH